MKRLLTISVLLLILFCSTAWAGDFAERYPRIGHRQGNVVLELGPLDVNDASQWPDRSGQGNHTNQTTAANQPAIQGSVGADVTVRSFDGANDFIASSDSTDWAYGTTNFTISVWVKFNKVAASQGGFYFQRVDGNDWIGFYHRLEGIYFVLVTASATKVNYTGAFTPVTVTDTWYHLLFQRVDTVAKLFINNVETTLNENTAFSTNPVPDLAASVVIGLDSHNGVYLDGSIASVIIFNTALTAAEVQYMYNVDRERYNQ